MSYTKGPWEYDNTQDNYYGNVIRKNGVIIAKMIHGRGTTVLEHNANAHLIAAAPDLLEACKKARSQIIALCSEDDVPDDVNLAIAKAEGK